MKKPIIFSTLLTCCIFLSSAQPFQSHHFTIQKLSDGVYAALATIGGYAICNAGIIDLGESVLIFDPFMTPEAAEDLKRVTQELTGHKVAYIVNSHFHNDHIGGNQAFEEAIIISTDATYELISIYQPEEIANAKVNAPIQLEKIMQRNTSVMTPHESEENTMWKGYYEGLMRSVNSLKTELPDITFSDTLILHGTKRTAVLLSWGEGHTESDLFLFLPAEQIAFLGDLLFIQNHPWLGDGDPDKWRTYLDRIAQLNLNILIPGHGPVGTIADIDSMIKYFDTVDDTARKYYNDGILPQNDSTLKSPKPYDQWFLSDFYSSNVIFEYNRMYGE